MPKKMRMMVLCGGPSSEHEISLKTAKTAFDNLDRKKYAPEIGIIGKNGMWSVGKGRPVAVSHALKKVKNFDFVFIAMHGAFGEDGRIQALLEWAGVPYSGSGVASSAMAMDKNISNILYSAHGMLVPEYAVVDSHSFKISMPFVVKPINGGSSVGVSIIRRRKDLKISSRVMVQEYVKGREFTCGVIEGPDGKPFALPPTEIIPRKASFFDYGAKYETGGSAEITPPKLPMKQIKELQALALTAHRILGCSGMSRSDFILRGSAFYILETNTIPGMTQTSLLPQAAHVAGISFPKLLDLIIAAGLRRNGIEKRIIKI
jgi:D-alanine-D-alanine ligase